MNAWRLGSVVIVLLGLWQLVAGLRSAPLLDAAPAAAIATSTPPAADRPAEDGWSTAGELSFSAQPPLSLGLSPLERPTQAASSDWERRLSDARSEQLRLEAITDLTPQQRDAALQAHLQRHFSAAERARVEAGLRLMPR